MSEYIVESQQCCQNQIEGHGHSFGRWSKIVIENYHQADRGLQFRECVDCGLVERRVIRISPRFCITWFGMSEDKINDAVEKARGQ